MATQPLSLLAAEAFLGLTLKHFRGPHRVGDARLLVNGRLNLWSEWNAIPIDDQRVIAQALRLRPESLCEEDEFLKWTERALARGVYFEPSEDEDHHLRRGFQAVAGVNVGEAVECLIAELQDRAGRSSRKQAAANDAGLLVLRDGERGYRVPADAIVQASISPPPKPAAALDSVALDRSRLQGLAAALDNADQQGRAGVLETMLFPGLLHGTAPFAESATLEAGKLSLFVAPTGKGKTILARLCALDWARQGVPVVLVVPTIKAVLREAYALEKAANALGTSLRVAPLIGSAGLFANTAKEIDEVSPDGPPRDWILERLGYYCALSAYGDEDEHAAAGEEPCSKLRQRVNGKREQAVSCPFATSCPKFRMYRAAAAADVIIVNHHAFLSGKVPADALSDGLGTSRLSVMELVLRRCGVVLIDEIDQLQGTAIDQGSGSLLLASKRRMSPVQELLFELERKMSGGGVSDEGSVAPLRRAVILLNWLAPELVSAINEKKLWWSPSDTIRWSRAKDGWLAKRLFGEAEGAQEHLEALFDRSGTLPHTEAEQLREVVTGWANRQIDDGHELTATQEATQKILRGWPTEVERRKLRQQHTVSAITDALILRADLDRLERSLQLLRQQLPQLEERGIDAASVVRDGLLGYAAWSPSPLGPLARRVVGFRFTRDAEDPGALQMQALTGDPHSVVSSLGGATALALAGARRVVVGLSATARFAGSPDADVVAPVVLAQPDGTDGITIEPATVQEPEADGEAIRISGVAGKERDDHAKRVGTLLWKQVLRDHLRELGEVPSTADRARALLVTGSYDEAESVAAGLAVALGPNASSRVRYLARSRTGTELPPAIMKGELEAFVATGADILVAPRQVVSRGHNILIPGTGRSAISSIFVLVRPVPPVDDASRALAHVSYHALKEHAGGNLKPLDALEAERTTAERQLRYVQQSGGKPFSKMPADLRHHAFCDVLVELEQLAGRARRGGTSVRIYLVDAAFVEGAIGWPELVREAMARWKSEGALAEMFRLHGPLMTALTRFAGL